MEKEGITKKEEGNFLGTNYIGFGVISNKTVVRRSLRHAILDATCSKKKGDDFGLWFE